MPIKPENRARYPKNWADLSKAIRFKRAQGWCECDGRCGWKLCGQPCCARNGERSPATGSTVVLSVAHLDHQPENNDEANLMAMCQGCHLHYDRDHHTRTRARTKREAQAARGQGEFCLEVAA